MCHQGVSLSISVNSFLKSGFGVLGSAIFGVALVKLISLHDGPAGVGTFGLFRQFFQFLAVFFTLGSGFSVVEGYQKAPDKSVFIKTIFNYVFFTTLIISVVVLVAAPLIHKKIFAGKDGTLSILYATPLFIIPLALHQLIKSILNGEGKIGRTGLLTSLPFMLMFLSAFISRDIFHLYLYSSVGSLAVSLWMFRKELKNFRPSFPFKRIVSFERTSWTAMITGAMGFFCFLAVKAICTQRIGIYNTGFLEASWSLVNYTTLVFLTSLSVYYLPKISGPHPENFKNHFFTLINLLGILSLVILHLADDFIIGLLFTDEFIGMEYLLFGMAIGEYLKCLNWFFIFTMLGTSHKKQYIVVDTIANLLFVGIIYFKTFRAVEMIGVAYIAFQVFYLLVNIALNFRYRFIKLKYLFLNLALGIAVWALIIWMKLDALGV